MINLYQKINFFNFFRQKFFAESVRMYPNVSECAKTGGKRSENIKKLRENVEKLRENVEKFRECVGVGGMAEPLNNWLSLITCFIADGLF